MRDMLFTPFIFSFIDKHWSLLSEKSPSLISVESTTSEGTSHYTHTLFIYSLLTQLHFFHEGSRSSDGGSPTIKNMYHDMIAAQSRQYLMALDKR